MQDDAGARISPRLNQDSPRCHPASETKRRRPSTDESILPPPPSLRLTPQRPNRTSVSTPHHQLPLQRPSVTVPTPTSAAQSAKAPSSVAAPRATPSRAAATPARGEVNLTSTPARGEASSSKKRPPSASASAAASGTPMSSRKRASTPANSVEMHVFSRQKQRPQAHHPSLVIASLFRFQLHQLILFWHRALQPPTPHTPSFCRRKRKPACFCNICVCLLKCYKNALKEGWCRVNMRVCVTLHLLISSRCLVLLHS